MSRANGQVQFRRQGLAGWKLSGCSQRLIAENSTSVFDALEYRGASQVNARRFQGSQLKLVTSGLFRISPAWNCETPTHS